jgi:hypothetical protein
VLQIGRQAYDTFDNESKADQEAFILADLERYLGLLALYTGRFTLASQHLSRSLEIHHTYSPSDSPMISYLYQDLSNAAASQGRLVSAVEFAERSCQTGSENLETHISRDLNTAQVKSLAIETSEARILYQRAIEQSQGEDKWAMLAL